jgi:hypothetical protein
MPPKIGSKWLTSQIPDALYSTKKGRFQEGTMQVGPLISLVPCLWSHSTSGYCWHYFVRVELGLMGEGWRQLVLLWVKNCCPPKMERWTSKCPKLIQIALHFLRCSPKIQSFDHPVVWPKCLDAGSRSPWLSIGSRGSSGSQSHFRGGKYSWGKRLRWKFHTPQLPGIMSGVPSRSWTAWTDG